MLYIFYRRIKVKRFYFNDLEGIRANMEKNKKYISIVFNPLKKIVSVTVRKRNIYFIHTRDRVYMYIFLSPTYIISI